MGKVFRIHKNNAAPVKDWSNYAGVSLKDISSQIDTANGDGSQLPSSIPSPFARIDLVKAAFEKVGSAQEEYKLDGELNYHKLISDSLDIGEIYFNYNTHKEHLTTVRWSKDEILKLINSQHKPHKLLGDTLNLFIEQDNQYGLDKTDNIFILKYNHEVIGATNPVVLFFASPDSHKADVKIVFRNDKMLDNEFRSLHLRDLHFVKYYVALVYSNLLQFEVLKNYVDRTIDKIVNEKPTLLNEFHQIKENAKLYFESTNGLEALHVDNASHSPMYLLNDQQTPLYQHTSQIDYSIESSFVIKGDRISNRGLPLVLPNSIFRDSNFKYTKGVWDPKTDLPIGYGDVVLSKRKLPNDNGVYPWISENDIFEDVIVRSELSFDSSKFITLGEEGYLVPIKPEMLEWFNIDTIVENLSIDKLAGDKLRIVLKVPVQGGFIPIERVYSGANSSDKQRVIKLPRSSSFGVGIYPFFKSQNDYFVSLVHQAGYKFNIESFLYNESSINSTLVKPTNRGGISDISNKIYKLEKFEFLGLTLQEGRNLLIPKLIEPIGAGSEELYCGVDFGTTNTHVETKKGSANSEPLNYLGKSIIGLLIDDSHPIGVTLNSNISQTFIDNDFGSDKFELKSPFRTCLLVNNFIDTKSVKIFENQNIGFDYEKRAIKDYLFPKTNIKWTGNREDAEVYIKELCQLLKLKSFVENVRLENVKLSWLYPTSMSTFEVSRLKEIWHKEFVLNFGDQNLKERLISLPESIAPFFHVIKTQQMDYLGKDTSVAIDIGGGTTDVMYYSYDHSNKSESDNIRFISSFKFAGNSIFGGGAAQDNIQLNGFYKKFQEELISELSGIEKSQSGDLLSNVSKINKPEEFINFFFSLENSGMGISLSDKMRNDQHLKLGFVLMYSAIIFHIAELLKSNGVKSIPKNLVFSGTGSKTINFIGNSVDYNQISYLAKGIFESVFDTKIDYNIDVKVPDEPKEITGKGAIDILQLNSDTFKDFNHTKKIKHSLVGGDADKAFESVKNYKDTKGETRQKLVEALELKTKEFVEIVKKLNFELSFEDKFGVSIESLAIYEDVILNSIGHSVDLVLKNKKDEEKISESLFFHSLNTNIPKLIYELSKI